MITVETQEKFISVAVLGEFTSSDYEEFEKVVLQHIEHDGGVDLLLDLRDMVNYTLDVAWEELRFAREHRYDFRHIAIVTSDEWMVWLAWVNRLFVDAEIQVFDEPGLALTWLGRG
jgi:hypothetical protein